MSAGLNKTPKEIWNSKLKYCWQMKRHCAYADDNAYCHFFKKEQTSKCVEEKRKMKPKKHRAKQQSLFDDNF